jgi:AcrR family transcriptional regulator
VDARRRDSRQLIVLAATEEFGQRGFAGARIERIAKSAGVNKQLIFYYFRSKARLFQTLIASVADKIIVSARTGEPTDTPLEELRVTVARVWETLAAETLLVRAAMLHPSYGETPSMGLGLALQSVADRIRSLISQGQGLGYVRDDVDAGTAAFHVVATAVGYVSLANVQPLGGGRRPAPIDQLLSALTW